MPISESLLPSIFQAKVTHPEYELWKDLSERDNKNWEDVQKSFIHKLQTLIPKHINKFKAHLVQGGPGIGQGQQRGKLSDAQYAAYKEAVKEGTNVHKDIYRKLLADMRKRLIEAKRRRVMTEALVLSIKSNKAPFNQERSLPL